MNRPDPLRWRPFRATHVLEQQLQDIRYAVRSLGRSPGLVATIVVTIAPGVSLNVALFTIFNAYVLRPLAIRDPHSVYSLGWVDRGGRDRLFLVGVRPLTRDPIRAVRSRGRPLRGRQRERSADARRARDRRLFCNARRERRPRTHVDTSGLGCARRSARHRAEPRHVATGIRWRPGHRRPNRRRAWISA
jgi:hypothetical protein